MKNMILENYAKELRALDCTKRDIGGNPILLPDGSKRENLNLRLAADFVADLIDSGMLKEKINYIDSISSDYAFMDIMSSVIASVTVNYYFMYTNKINFVIPEVDIYIDNNGVCEKPGNCMEQIRYRRNGNIYMKKIGKLIREQFKELLGNLYPSAERAINRYCEIASTNWGEYHSRFHNLNLEVVIDDDFDKIYDNDNYCTQDFDSCMQSKPCVQFYNDISCDCRAVSLEDCNELIYARAILFNDVYDEDGNKYRMLERVYGQSDKYKSMLLNLVIQQGLIDCHKELNASCRDAKRIVGVGECENEDFYTKKLHIDCSGIDYDFVPYLDTFKYFNYNEQRAYNDSSVVYDITLTETDGSIDEPYICDDCGSILFGDDANFCRIDGKYYCDCCSVWSDYHSTYIPSTCAQEFELDGRTDYVHVERIDDDFAWVGETLYHVHSDTIRWSERLGDFILDDDSAYDYINRDYIPEDESVEYKDMYSIYRGWDMEYLTHEDEIGVSVFRCFAILRGVKQGTYVDYSANEENQVISYNGEKIVVDNATADLIQYQNSGDFSVFNS